MTIKDRFNDLLFGVRRSIRYHNRRRAHYDRLHSFNTTIGVIGGSAVIVAILARAGELWPLAFAAVIAVSSAIDLVANNSRMARTHHDLSRKYFEIEKEMAASRAPTEEAVTHWTQQRLTIEAEEPPVLHILNAICHNELCRALGYGYQVKISPVQRLLSNFIDLNEHTLQPPPDC